MDKKAITLTLPIIIGLVLIVGVVGGVFYYNVSEAELPSGCIKIGETDERVGSNSDNFVCEFEKCEVQAVIDIEKPTTTDTLECSTCIRNNGRNVAVRLVNDGSYERTERCDNAIDTSNPDGFKACRGSIITQFKADWGFCPSGNLNYLFCKCISKTISGDDEHFSQVLVLNNNGVVNFDPRYPDGSPVTSKRLIIKNYDCTCTNEIESGDACDPNDDNTVFCEPQGISSCPAGKTFYPKGTEYYSGGCVSLENDVCAVFTVYTKSSDCGWIPLLQQIESLGVTSNHYRSCDTDKPNSICSTFGNTKTSQVTNEICYINNDKTNFGPGIGVLGFPDDNCLPGSYVGVSGNDNAYKKCIDIGGLYDFRDRNCPPSLIFNPSATNDNDVCVCDNECEPDDVSCSDSNSQESCVSFNTVDTGGKLCWEKETFSCESEQKCSGNSCGCDYSYTGKCSVIGENKCDGNDKFITCGYNPNDDKSCPKFRYNPNQNLGGDCLDTERCDNGFCEPRTDIGCQNTNSPNYVVKFKCSEEKDTNNLNIEECTNPNCTPVNDIFLAEPSDIGVTKCYQGNVYSVSNPYSTRDNNIIYRWELSETCGVQAPVCIGDKLI